jgi:hypothetical protein
MIEFTLYFKIKEKKLVDLFKELIKQKIEIPHVEISPEYSKEASEIIQLAKENSIPVKEIKVSRYLKQFIRFGELSSYSIEGDMRNITLEIYMNYDQTKPKKRYMEYLTIMTKVFGNVEFNIIDFDFDSKENPRYEGRWDLEEFLQKILPKMIEGKKYEK